jgi:predicted anti-sigma-YlaC factor YlaD
MFCDEALSAIEEIAAGDRPAEGRIGEHLATCADCAAALAAARQVEHLLRERPVPRASPQFTARTMARVRRARWRSDQMLDAGFNAAIAIIVLAIVAGVWMFLNRSGLTSVGDEAVEASIGAARALAQRLLPALPLYAGATALLAGALAFWWWAERPLGN